MISVRVDFERQIKREFHDTTVIGDADASPTVNSMTPLN
jgi:hypothetical protein